MTAEPKPTTLAELLTAWRAESGLSFDALVARSGVTKSVVSELCRGKRDSTSVATFARLAAACGVSPTRTGAALRALYPLPEQAEVFPE